MLTRGGEGTGEGLEYNMSSGRRILFSVRHRPHGTCGTQIERQNWNARVSVSWDRNKHYYNGDAIKLGVTC